MNTDRLANKVEVPIFERGYFKDSNVSNYTDYMSKKHDLLAQDLVSHFGFNSSDNIIDFGAATGSLILEFSKRGLENVVGTDVSYYAVQYGKEVLKLGDKLQYFNLELLSRPKDYVIILDVLEHVPTQLELNKIVDLAAKDLRKNLIVRIPVSKVEGENYFLEVSRNDKTHVQCHDKSWWNAFFQSKGLQFTEELTLPSIYGSDGVLAGVYKKTPTN